MRSMDFGQVMLAGYGAAGGAIAGVALASWWTMRRMAGQMADDGADGLMQAAGSQSMADGIASAIKGGLVGAVVGLLMGVAYLWWSNRDDLRDVKPSDFYEEEDPGDAF